MSISKNQSTVLKGLAILLVIFSHILGKYTETDELIRNLMGTGGVGIFFILSGYGLFSSYKAKGLGFKPYWNNKINKVFVPYSIVTIVFWALLKRDVTKTILLKNLLTIDYDRNIDATMWYISLLLIWYIVFFVVFYFDFNIILKLAIIVLTAFALRENESIFKACAWQITRNILFFPLGVILGYVDSIIPSDKIKPIIRKCMCFVFFAMSVAGYYWLYKRQEESFFKFGVLLFIICLSLVKIISLISDKLLLPLKIVGVHSFAAYLVEAKLLDYHVAHSTINSRLLSVMVYFLILAGLCLIIDYKKTISYLKQIKTLVGKK